eukprot:CAMPEP_0176368896 /NCGR_PEP_ID=MMETSP0126-20121128/22915_1 /TAXON_ID=141414 ORGANISM="Strombidinopsis acuminatum, Strain SPMC142" /NCGR_SAMPLE_ID=MMETSP0126 /ASSEMBLY_ACC=CAM_ASM_000229 /LENGTH=45 /DNA_ID= /DNA_START= /DNA_END= /DNA_ORIENTATION=
MEESGYNFAKAMKLLKEDLAFEEEERLKEKRERKKSKKSSRWSIK